MIAAIGSDGTRAVVWGIGADQEEAARDARRWYADGAGCDPGPLAYAELPPAVAQRVEDGIVGCAELGIKVKVVDGRVVAARYAPAPAPAQEPWDPEVGILAPRSPAEHSTDADCNAAGQIDPETGDCQVCGIGLGEQCLVCGGERYHLPACAEGDGFVAPVGCERCAMGVVVGGGEVIACTDCAGFGLTDVADTLAAAFVNRVLADAIALRPTIWRALYTGEAQPAIDTARRFHYLAFEPKKGDSR